MLLNYHEMTLGQSRNDPAKRQQFAVICAVISSVLIYSLMTSGLFTVPVEPVKGKFPGGYFAYKYTNRDYASSHGLGRAIWRGLNGGNDIKDSLTRISMERITYHMYYDDPPRMGGRRQRFAVGALVSLDEHDAQMKKADIVDKLLSTNAGKRTLTEQDREDMTARQYFDALSYEYAELPAVDSLVLQFPHTHGFISPLVFSYYIIPKLRKMAIEQGEKENEPIVISNCSKEQQMCTYYVPLVQGKFFLFGRDTTEVHLSKLGEEHYIDIDGLMKGAKKVFPFLFPKKQQQNQQKEEEKPATTTTTTTTTTETTEEEKEDAATATTPNEGEL